MWLHWLYIGWPDSKGPSEDILTSVAIAVSESYLVVPIEVPKFTLEFIQAPFPKSGLFILFILLLEGVILASKFGQKVAFLTPDQRAKKLESDFFPQFPVKFTCFHNSQWQLHFFPQFLLNQTCSNNLYWTSSLPTILCEPTCIVWLWVAHSFLHVRLPSFSPFMTHF